MYNLTFDNPYNREVVRKLQSLRERQCGKFVPTNIEPEHIIHHYDPITITGGAREIPSSSSRATSAYPPDLFEPRYTFNRNQMVGNKLNGGSSALLNESIYPGINFHSGGRKGMKTDLGNYHSKRRGGSLVDKLNDSSSDSSSDEDNKIMKLKKIKIGNGKKKMKKESKNQCKSSQLLKIFN
jgi:hypothetical protein